MDSFEIVYYLISKEADATQAGNNGVDIAELISDNLKDDIWVVDHPEYQWMMKVKKNYSVNRHKLPISSMLISEAIRLIRVYGPIVRDGQLFAHLRKAHNT